MVLCRYFPRVTEVFSCSFCIRVECRLPVIELCGYRAVSCDGRVSVEFDRLEVGVSMGVVRVKSDVLTVAPWFLTVVIADSPPGSRRNHAPTLLTST